ncbi:MAG: class I SAM-dependent methyltransferase [Chitinophagaceae bacterium]|nr:class I SAM-dependent methyltransferase [Chitinophagaceae bacterium]
MNSSKENEQRTAAAFTRQSAAFDELYGSNPVIQYKRERVRNHVQQYLLPHSNILELNSGTGEDAIWFAQPGHTTHATDLSAGMQDILKNKVATLKLDDKISTEVISFTQLENLKQQTRYDLIFSNFAGLNCTGELDKVLDSFSVLLKPGGIATLVILPKFCLWEFLLLFKGKFKTAFRRFLSSKGVTAHIEGEYFKCWYYNPSFIIKHLQKEFDLVAVEGLCTLVPPSYMEGFAEKHPNFYAFLGSKEEKWKGKWPWRNIGDYYIISVRKKPGL